MSKESKKTSRVYIVRGSKSAYTVVIPVAAAAVERNAADELIKYVGLMSGARLPLKTDAEKVTGKVLSVGRTKFASAADVNPTGMNIDGFAVTVDDKENVYILGEQGRGTLYGVYELLTRNGCRFLTADFEVVPKKATLFATEISEVPAFEFRTVFCYAARFDADYCAKMRFYSAPHVMRGPEAQRIGGTKETMWLGDFHSLCEYVPAEKYYPLHPDWFTGPSSNSQPCLSSGLNDDGTLAEGESYVRTLIENITEKVAADENHELRYVTVGQMDNYKYCRCDRCLRQVEKLGGKRSGQLVLLANTVAREVKKRLREMGKPRDELEFITTSYQWSDVPPAGLDENGDRAALVPEVVPADDVIVWYTPADACFMHGLEDPKCSYNDHEYGLYFKWWRRITDRLFIWDYHTNYAEWLAWFPDVCALKDNYVSYKKAGVRGILTETETLTRGFYKADLTAYLASRLMWNPEQSVKRLVAEFNRYCFGKEAGKIVTDLVWFIENRFLRLAMEYGSEHRHLGIVTNGSKWISSAWAYSRGFTDEAIARLKAADEAVEKCAADEATKAGYRRNLDYLRAQVLYFKFRRYDESGYPQEEKRAFVDEYVALLKKNDVKALGEGWGKSIGKYVDDLYAFAFPEENKQ